MAGRQRAIDSLCMGCGNCMEICPCGAVELLRDEKRGTPFVEIGRSRYHAARRPRSV